MLTPGCYHETSDDDSDNNDDDDHDSSDDDYDNECDNLQWAKSPKDSEQKSKRHMLSVNKSPKDSNATL